jgi:hypothetical protein
VTHVTGTAQMSAVLTRERGAVTLVSSSGKLQYEQFLSHIIQWSDKHLAVLGFRPTEPLMPEWIRSQICSNADLFDAKQRDPKMTNPNSTEMIAFLYTQRDLLFERKDNARSVHADRVLLIKDQCSPSSDEESPRPTRPTTKV